MTVGARLPRPMAPVLLAGALAFLCAAAATAWLLVRSQGGTLPAADGRRATVSAVVGYSNAIYRPTVRAGEAIVAGIKPDIADFESGKMSLSLWDSDTESRAVVFSQVRSSFSAVSPPNVIAGAEPYFDQAFADYQLATWALWEAGQVGAGGRSALIDMAGRIGDAGDRLFDLGTGVIQRARRALGLGPDPRFSNTGASQ